MSERIKAINKYYTELKYNMTNKINARRLINLDIGTKLLKDTKNLSERFFGTSSLIELYFPIFVSLCGHVDVVTALIEYLNYFGAKFLFDYRSDESYTVESYKNIYIPITLILTIYTMCKEEAVISFLKNTIIEDSALNISGIPTYVKCMMDNLNQANEMIILEDSDLHAVINCLMIIDYSLSKIWIQKSIKKEFLMFKKKYLNYSRKCPIDIFQSQQELLAISTPRNCLMNIISIWSEDIVAAKNLASCFDADIVFINTHMDFTGGLLFVPFARKLDNLMDHATMNSIDKTNTSILNILPSINTITPDSDEYKNYSKIINLFYDGMWQKPVEKHYFKHNDTLFANATNDDIRRCIKSAKKGFKIWGANSVVSRKAILSNLAITLSYNRKIILSNLVERCTKFATFYENSSGHCTQDENLELINSSKARGIIILKEENENTLFLRLTQSLLAGNSIIVICNENLCNIKPYMYMFSMCDIPPGVINMLSNERIIDLESKLYGTRYSVYAKRYFSEGNIVEKNINSYINLSLPKQIVHLLK